MATEPTTQDRLERLERAMGQLGLQLQRVYGSRLWRGAPDLLELTENYCGEKFDPRGSAITAR